MKFGLIPVNIGVANAAQMIGMAQLAESVGFESVWTFEHVIVPVDYKSKYPYSPNGKMGATPETNFIDPLIALDRDRGADARRSGSAPASTSCRRRIRCCSRSRRRASISSRTAASCSASASAGCRKSSSRWARRSNAAARASTTTSWR